MKYAFIINPTAGQGKGIDNLIEHINNVATRKNAEYSVHVTGGVGDAKLISQMLAEEKEELRIIVCGGDGTFNEAVNGVIGYDVPVGIVPIGTGNDFVRNFENEDEFLDIEKQFDFEPVEVDLLKYKYEVDGVVIEKYCTNVFNIGFDGNVAILAGKLKELPLIAGSFAYLSSIIFNLITKRGQTLMVTADGEEFYKGSLLLCSIANGNYCGGGICSSPKAVTNDGLMDLQIVKNLSRIKFLKLLPIYMKGEILNRPEVADLIKFKQVQKVKIVPKDKTMEYCVDGEPVTTGKIEIEIIEKGFKFLTKSCVNNK
ncbi:MAG: diacylglycerol kinase family lipid kinase [Peptostreptococcaceae bacterium]|nr:diacylglycerol kinase family lipid kinase [Peptostreptococcaceae bacterium]